MIDRLKGKKAFMIYAADHGESLGECGRLTHGASGDAPEQREIPFIVWMSDNYKEAHPDKWQAIESVKANEISHDYIFHSILDCLGIESEIVDKSLSLCRTNSFDKGEFHKMQIYIIAGENSGDFIGGLLMKALRLECKEHFGEVEFHGVGGQQMELVGLESLFPLNQINLMGFVEVIPHIFRIKKLIDQTVEDILVRSPQIVITIDSPGFTFRVAEKIREVAPNTKLVHIVAPSVWAYKSGRAKKYAKIYDHMLTLLPFEPEFFTEKGMSSMCIGHPALEQAFYEGSLGLRGEMNIDDETKVVAVTPGSRKGEISRHMPIIRKVFDELSATHKIKIIFVQADESNIRLISKFLNAAKFNYSFSTDRLKAFAVSDCAFAKSGTNTLEIAASGTPMIVGYKLNPITFVLLKMFIKVKYASLINIIPDREIIPEYIQSDFNVENIVLALSDLLSDPKRAKSQVAEAQKILKSIGLSSKKKPSMVAAKTIVNML